MADERLQGVLEALDPLLDGGLAVVGPGEDVGEPDGDQPAVGKSLMERMGRELAIDDLGDAEFDQEAQQQGHVIDPLVGQFQSGAVFRSGRRLGGDIINPWAGQVQGDDHGCSPTRPGRKASLYRSGRPEWKIQEKEREHGNAR